MVVRLILQVKKKEQKCSTRMNFNLKMWTKRANTKKFLRNHFVADNVFLSQAGTHGLVLKHVNSAKLRVTTSVQFLDLMTTQQHGQCRSRS